MVSFFVGAQTAVRVAVGNGEVGAAAVAVRGTRHDDLAVGLDCKVRGAAVVVDVRGRVAVKEKIFKG